MEENEDRIVLGNRRCPFGEKVLGRPSMCMMTSNVFGSIRLTISVSPRSIARDYYGWQARLRCDGTSQVDTRNRRD